MQDNGGMQDNNSNLFPVNGPQQYNSGTQQEWGGQPAQVNQPTQPIQTSPFNQPNESLTAQPITQPTAEFVDNNPANINPNTVINESFNQPANDTPTSSPTDELPQIQPITWTASESVTEKRSTTWYAVVVGIFIVIVAASILLFIFNFVDLLTLISTLVLAVAMFVALLVSTKLPNRESTYVLSSSGIDINGQHYGFDSFRAFGVRQSGGLWQLVLIPVKRFGMETVAFIDEHSGEQIVDILANYLPMEEVPENGVDKLIGRLKI